MSLQSLGLDPAVFDPDYESDSSGKDKSGHDHRDEEADPMLICAFRAGVPFCFSSTVTSRSLPANPHGC